MSLNIPNRKTLAFYRRLLHTMMKTFDGDYVMFHKVRLEARKEILKNKNEIDPIKIQNHIFFGEEARDLLEVNLVQVFYLSNKIIINLIFHFFNREIYKKMDIID